MREFLPWIFLHENVTTFPENFLREMLQELASCPIAFMTIHVMNLTCGSESEFRIFIPLNP